jgi:hypothetical protein
MRRCARDGAACDWHGVIRRSASRRVADAGGSGVESRREMHSPQFGSSLDLSVLRRPSQRAATSADDAQLRGVDARAQRHASIRTRVDIGAATTVSSTEPSVRLTASHRHRHRHRQMSASRFTIRLCAAHSSGGVDLTPRVGERRAVSGAAHRHRACAGSVTDAARVASSRERSAAHRDAHNHRSVVHDDRGGG